MKLTYGQTCNEINITFMKYAGPMWVAETCETRLLDQRAWRIWLKCSFLLLAPPPLCKYFKHTHTHTHKFPQPTFDLPNCFWNNNVWWQNGSHWTSSFFLSESVSIRTLALSLAPLHFPGVSFWVYLFIQTEARVLSFKHYTGEY